jgi:ATP-binding protein involved in chromosome partitioning
LKSYHDVQGDGGSRVLEQVLDLRQRIAGRLAGVRHRLAIGSGKGGVGKSTLTLQLARGLRARGRSVAILDVDLNGPCQAQLAGLEGVTPLPGPDGLVLPRTSDGVAVLSLGSVLAEREALAFDSVADDESHTWRATRERTLLLDLIAGADWGRLDVLLLDLPPGAERTAQAAELLGPETDFLLVTLPAELARVVVARSATALARLPNRVLGYVENMSGLFPIAGGAELDLPCLGRIPFDPALAAPGPAAGAAAAALRELAGRVDELLEAR